MSSSTSQRSLALRALKFSTILIALCRWTIFSIFIDSCISPYTQANETFTESIVIQGMVTDEPGPYQVTVSKTMPIESQAISQTTVPAGISGATVIVSDDQGNSEQLVEKSTGYYYTKSLQGIVGRSYSLTVATTDGNSYQSSTQRLLPVGDFDYFYQFKQVEDPFGGDQITSKNGFEVTINSRLDPGQEGRVWWRTIGTYHVETYPQDKMKWISVGRPPVLVFAPAAPACAGTPLHPACTCCNCWISDYDRTPRLSDPRFINNGAITNLQIGFVAATRRTMYEKYVLEIQQLSVSEDVYNFWKLVQVNSLNSSNLFQTPPPRSIGTFTSQSSSAKTVLGYFAASSIKRRYVSFTPAMVPYKIYPIDNVTESCLVAYRNSTNQKPVFW